MGIGTGVRSSRGSMPLKEEKACMMTRNATSATAHGTTPPAERVGLHNDMQQDSADNEALGYDSGKNEM
jgi:hypothetical protein